MVFSHDGIPIPDAGDLERRARQPTGPHWLGVLKAFIHCMFDKTDQAASGGTVMVAAVLSIKLDVGAIFIQFATPS